MFDFKHFQTSILNISQSISKFWMKIAVEIINRIFYQQMSCNLCVPSTMSWWQLPFGPFVYVGYYIFVAYSEKHITLMFTFCMWICIPIYIYISSSDVRYFTTRSSQKKISILCIKIKNIDIKNGYASGTGLNNCSTIYLALFLHNVHTRAGTY